MREHKYRAWDTVKKVMYSAEELGRDQEALLPDGRGFANISGDSTRLTQIHSHLLPLEYIGIPDKNGVEIYEGDIVGFLTHRWDSNGQHSRVLVHREVKFVDGCFEAEDMYNEDCFIVEWKETEVIGNIYENPKLIPMAMEKNA